MSSFPTLSPRCSLYYHDASKEAGTGLPAKFVPPDWPHHQYSMEHWLERALIDHPWRTASQERADAVWVASNFSMRCIAGKSYSSRRTWEHSMRDRSLWKHECLESKRCSKIVHASTVQPKLIPLQSLACKNPWTDSTLPRDVLFLLEYQRMSARRGNFTSLNVVSPFVVSRPPWLVGTATPPPRVPWLQRKLLFFSGHIPKLYINPLRYRLWRQVRSREDVTTVSHTLSCALVQFRDCSRGDAWLRAQPHDWYQRHCRPWCGASAACQGSCQHCDTVPQASWQQQAFRKYRKQCGAYRRINVSEEEADAVRDTRRLPHHEHDAPG